MRYGRIAEDSSIRAALVDPSGRTVDGARAALRKLGIRPDSGLPIELWDATGKSIASVGSDSGPALSLEMSPEVNHSSRLQARVLQSVRVVDTAQLSELEPAGGRVLYWLVMPVRVDGNLLGFVASRRHIATGPQTEATIRELSANSAAGYYRNADGTTWASFGGHPISPPESIRTRSGFERIRPRVGRMLFSETPIPGTPLVIGMEAPRSVVLALANSTASQLGFFGGVLTLLGAGLTWLVGRHVTRPLRELTSAADSVARGDYAARVPVVGSDEIALLASSFNHMATQIGEDRRQLETANRAKTDFLAAMSHELRTPLNAIGGYTELMEMGVRGPITEEQRRDLARIRASQAHLLGLIGSLLDLTRIESGRVSYDLANIALDPFLGSLEALVLPQAAAKRQTLEYVPCDIDATVRADREKLRQILLNLLSNAVRYSPSGSSITMRARPRDDGRVDIQVADNGPGIPLDRQRAVFEPFVQLDRSLTQGKEGVGLGLSISRDLARGMNGQLTVESVPGEGATFTVTLPAGVRGEKAQVAVSGSMEAVPSRR